MSPGERLGPDEAREWLNGLRTLRSRTRRDRRAGWFPLAVLGVVALGATPFYGLVSPKMAAAGGAVAVSVGQGPPLAAFTSSTSTTIYWLVAGPLACLATAAFYWQRARRRGLGASPVPFLVTGLTALVLLIVLTTTRTLDLNDFTAQGLLPLLAVALGLLALARSERSSALVVATIVLLGLVVVASLYDLSNLFPRLGLGQGIGDPGQTNIVVVAFGFLLLSAGFGAGALKASRRER